MIPEEAGTAQVAEIARQTGLKMMLVSDADTYHKTIAGLGANFQVKHIVTLFDDDQVLVPGRTAIFEWVIDPGKVYWREHLPEIKELKASVKPDDVCCITYHLDENGKLENEIETHASLAAKAEQHIKMFGKLMVEGGSLMICVPYFVLQNRLLGFYLPLWFRQKILIPNPRTTIEHGIKFMRPTCVVLSAIQLNGLDERLKGWISLKGWVKRKRYQMALSAGAKYIRTLDNDQKPGIFLRWKFGRARKLLKQGLMQTLDAGLASIILNSPGVADPAISLFLYMDFPVYRWDGVRVTQANRHQIVSLSPVSEPFVKTKIPKWAAVEEMTT